MRSLTVFMTHEHVRGTHAQHVHVLLQQHASYPKGVPQSYPSQWSPYPGLIDYPCSY